MSRGRRICQEDQENVSQIAKVFRIPVTTDVWDWCEVGERWDETLDTSDNVVVIKLARRQIAWNLVTTWPTISALPHLMELRLEYNNLEGGFPDSMPPSLERLYLDNNPKLKGTLPQSMKFRKLKVLWLNNCGIKGGIPYSIGDLWAIKQLYLAENQREFLLVPSSLA